MNVPLTMPALPSVAFPSMPEMPAMPAMPDLALPEAPKLVPLDVPFPRRRQTLAVAFWMWLLPLFLLAFGAMLYFSYITRSIALVYVIYQLQDNGQQTGARRQQWLRRLPFWVWFADFFPVTLRKESDLDPSHKFIFGYHPHGVISMGAFTSFATEARNVSQLLPGLNIRLLTLEVNFNVPLWRDLLLFLNVASADRKSIDHVLKGKPGNGVMLVLGGAAESMETFPGTNKLILKSRLGFIKIALQHGATLVPTFGFGENDIWDQVANPKGSPVRKFQEAVKRVATFSPLLFHGRSLLTYNYGIMPYRRPITVVTGVPIVCPKMDTITEADLLQYQKLYIEGVQSLYDKYKDELLPNRKEDLIIL
ncbi:diacylglycerol O-acyltransferase 1 [Chytriomyces hyalinus]|nr:diacylglycerol O-acyltransferase 1 [Chytriomyces hyalinus]